MSDPNLEQVDSIFDEFKKYYGKLSALVASLVVATLAVVTVTSHYPPANFKSLLYNTFYEFNQT